MNGATPQTVSSAERFRSLVALCGLACALLMCACAAASRPADPTRPRADAAPYPIILEASDERREKALAAWTTLVGEQAGPTAPTPELRPVTATISALPATLSVAPRMPKVGAVATPTQTEEETRESLRRFIETAAPLLGLERRPPAAGLTERESMLADLSLVEIADGSGGAKLALYRQNPFDLPLRNGYGDIEVGFTPDLRVTRLQSQAIPDTERLRRAVTNVRQGLAPDKLAASLHNRNFTFTGANGTQQTRTVTSVEAVVVRELVVFPQPLTGAADKLELRLAWEISIGAEKDAPIVYVDAVTGEQLFLTPAAQT